MCQSRIVLAHSARPARGELPGGKSRRCRPSAFFKLDTASSYLPSLVSTAWGKCEAVMRLWHGDAAKWEAVATWAALATSKRAGVCVGECECG